MENQEQVLAAVRFSQQPPQKTAKPGNTGKKDGKGPQPKQPAPLVLCGRHLRFGQRCYRCKDPSTCQYPKN